MPTGIKLPFKVNSSGGISLSSDEEQNAQIIKLKLGDGDNENAFQQNITLGIDMIFAIGDPVIQGKITGRLYNAFEDFERDKRFKLLKNTIEWVEGDGEMTLSFRYIDLESDQPKTFTETFSGI